MMGREGAAGTTKTCSGRAAGAAMATKGVPAAAEAAQALKL